MARKKVPISYAVVAPTKGSKLLAAEGKAALMDRVRTLTDDGEKIVTALMRVMSSGEKDSDVIRAAETLLNYGFGKPIETSVQANISDTGGNLGALSSAQLEAVASGVVDVEEDAEVVAEPVPEAPKV